MSIAIEPLEILYVGKGGQAFQNCVEPLGWYVYLPQTGQQALGMYMAYWPHIIVLDTLTEPETAYYVYEQLLSVKAAPILIFDQGMQRQMPGVDGLHRVGSGIPFEEIIKTIQALVEQHPRVF